MGKKWTIKAADNAYEIEYTARNFIVNGSKYPHKECLTFKKWFFFQEYKMPIPEADVLMVTQGMLLQPVVDGRYLLSGKPFRRPEKIPGWAWAVVVLNMALMCLGGAIPAAFGAGGTMLTFQVSADPERSTRKKIQTSILILISVWVGALVTCGLFFVVVELFREGLNSRF